MCECVCECVCVQSIYAYVDCVVVNFFLGVGACPVVYPRAPPLSIVLCSQMDSTSARAMRSHRPSLDLDANAAGGPDALDGAHSDRRDSTIGTHSDRRDSISGFPMDRRDSVGGDMDGLLMTSPFSPVSAGATPTQAGANRLDEFAKMAQVRLRGLPCAEAHPAH